MTKRKYKFKNIKEGDEVYIIGVTGEIYKVIYRPKLLKFNLIIGNIYKTRTEAEEGRKKLIRDKPYVK